MTAVALPKFPTAPHAGSRGRTLRAYRFGSADPCVHITEIQTQSVPPTLTMTSHTLEGPAWTHVDRNGVTSFGGPAARLVGRWSADPAGLNDGFRFLQPSHPAVERLQRDFGHVRIGSSGDVYKAALTATLGQRITAAEAVAQWRRLCTFLGESVATPIGDMRTPPPPDALARLVPYELHHIGIEEARARTIIGIARVFSRRGEHLTHPELALRRLVAEVPRFGPWTQALVAAEALGDPDAVPVGDFHVKNVVAYALRGVARGTDDEMLADLTPYAGQRGRVVMWLGLAGIAAPKFGPRRVNPDIRRF